MTAADAGAREAQYRGGVIRQLIRVCFLVRLLALLGAAVGMLLGGFDLTTAWLSGALAASSYLGLRSTRVLDVVVRHPSLALADTLLVFAAILLVGQDAPLALVAVSSALLIGLLLTVRVLVLLLLLLVVGTLVSGEVNGRGGIGDVQDAVVLISVTVIGVAFRVVVARQHQAEASAAEARAAAAAAQERLRLARELHDTVAKSVQGLALAASALPTWIQRNPEIAYTQAQSVARGAKDAVAAARGMMTTLRLDDVSRPFHEVLSDLVSRCCPTVTCDVTLSPVPGLGAASRHEMLAAAAEAMENVARHAPGAAVTVSLCSGADGTTLVIADNGPGFGEQTRERSAAAGHFGLIGMAERMHSVGGSAVVASAPGAGTSVRLWLPAAVGADLPADRGPRPVKLRLVS